MTTAGTGGPQGAGRIGAGRRTQGGVTLSGLLFWGVLLGVIALVAMKLFPLYNEKMKVDFALERVASDPASGTQSKPDLVKAVMKQFEISDVDRWTTPEFMRLLQVEKNPDTDERIMSVEYEIRGPLCCDLDIVLNYHKALPLTGGNE